MPSPAEKGGTIHSLRELGVDEVSTVRYPLTVPNLRQRTLLCHP